jgi:two-component system sensor histidine kinase KdpD
MAPRSWPVLLRSERGRPLLGLAVAAASVSAATGAVYALKSVAPVVALSVVYLPAVLLVSAYWGLALGLATALASAAAFNFFHLPPVGELTISDSRNWVALAAFTATASVVSTMAELARSGAREAERRRGEADLAAALARELLAGSETRAALGVTGRRVAEALALSSAAIEIGGSHASERREAIPLGAADGSQIATLLVPRGLPAETRERLQTRVVPALAALVAIALRRDALQAEAVERVELSAGVVDEGGRLSRLVDKLLDLSVLQAGNAEPRRDWVSLEEVVIAAREGLSDRAADIRLSIDPDVPAVRADAAQLERAFANLLENAARYSGGEPVLVRARAVGQRMRVRVVDRGPGISPSEQERVFMPIYRSPDSGISHEGSGLGLAIAKGFIEAGGGTIHVESLPGQGTSFVVELPLEAAAPEGPESPAPRGEPVLADGRP